jgi:phosphoglycerol transferase
MILAHDLPACQRYCCQFHILIFSQTKSLMINNNMASSDSRLKTYWFCATIALFVYFWFRNAGMNAVVMADEWYYSSLARLTAPEDISIPSYLYTSVYHATTACGAGYLDCARLFNTMFFLASAPFIYLVGRHFLSARLASLVALLAMLGPVNSYTAYFMPESIYFCTFWMSTWAAFRFVYKPTFANAALLGVFVGGLALLKLHALFLIPSIGAFMLYSVLRLAPGSAMRSWRHAAVCIAVMLAITVIVRFGFGYLIAGKAGLSLSGSLYASQASNSTGQQHSVLELIKLSLFNLRGHVSALTILFGVPIAAVLVQLFDSRSGAEESVTRSPLAVYTILILLALLGMTVTFTAFVAGSGYESNMRLHMRYYNFALPLLVMFAATQIGRGSQPRNMIALVIAATLAIIIVFTISTVFQPYTPSMVDSPEFHGMSARRAAFYVLGLVSLGSVVTWAWSRELGARIFLFGFMPLFVIVATSTIHKEVRNGGATNDFDRAGIFAHEFLTADQRDKLGIIGTDVSGMFRTRFHVDSIRQWQRTAPQNEPLDLSGIPSDTAWLLLLGSYQTPPGAVVRMQTASYSLVELNAMMPKIAIINFGDVSNRFLKKWSGLSGIEPWGRWSSEKIVELELSNPLPKRFKLLLLAEAYGPNAGRDIVVSIGKNEKKIQLTNQKSSVEMTFENAGEENVIKLTVPHPISPNALNGAADARNLGIGFTKLEIHDLTR